jgi:hypothetical protein
VEQNTIPTATVRSRDRLKSHIPRFLDNRKKNNSGDETHSRVSAPRFRLFAEKLLWQYLCFAVWVPRSFAVALAHAQGVKHNSRFCPRISRDTAPRHGEIRLYFKQILETTVAPAFDHPDNCRPGTVTSSRQTPTSMFRCALSVTCLCFPQPHFFRKDVNSRVAVLLFAGIFRNVAPANGGGVLYTFKIHNNIHIYFYDSCTQI